MQRWCRAVDDDDDDDDEEEEEEEEEDEDYDEDDHVDEEDEDEDGGMTRMRLWYRWPDLFLVCVMLTMFAFVFVVETAMWLQNCFHQMASGQVDAAMEIASCPKFKLGMRHKTDSKYD